ncbi:periplasmic binding protein domain-containing protein [Chytridium lagenaria]|nr:periplasmic binding protein domain-containing protein [Chytridium lagenaria]
MVPLKGWLLVAVIICMVVDGVVGQAVTTSAPIHVGILHSATGSMAAFESPLVQAELLAIDEINAAGGVLGRRVVPVIRDGASNLDTFVNEAKSLVSNASIATVFGCGSPACRIAVKPVFEASNTLLWHPIHHEGQDCSRSIMYTGATANQKIEPAIRFLINNYAGFRLSSLEWMNLTRGLCL